MRERRGSGCLASRDANVSCGRHIIWGRRWRADGIGILTSEGQTAALIPTDALDSADPFRHRLGLRDGVPSLASANHLESEGHSV